MRKREILMAVLFGILTMCLTSGSAIAADYRAYWMSTVKANIWNTPLNRVVMPGTHDTATFGGDCPWVPCTRTQYKNMRGQLDRGARYLDLRPKLEGGHWMTHHGSITCGSFTDILRDITEFTAANPHELLILHLSHIETVEAEKTHDDWRELVKTTLGTSFMAERTTSMGDPAFTPLTPMSEFWNNGKRYVVIYDDPYQVDHPDPAFWGPDDIVSPWPDTSHDKLYSKLDYYLSKREYGTHVGDTWKDPYGRDHVITKGKDLFGPADEKLFVLQGIGNSPCPDSYCTDLTTEGLDYWWFENSCAWDKSNPPCNGVRNLNIVMVDFFEEYTSLTDKIFSINRRMYVAPQDFWLPNPLHYPLHSGDSERIVGLFLPPDVEGNMLATITGGGMEPEELYVGDYWTAPSVQTRTQYCVSGQLWFSSQSDSDGIPGLSTSDICFYVDPPGAALTPGGYLDLLDLPPKVKNSYLANLKKVIDFISHGQTTAAINQLEAFIHKVQSDMDHEIISFQVGDMISRLAEDLVLRLEQ